MGVPAHFTILWLCWPSRRHIYGSVDPQLEGCENELFLVCTSTLFYMMEQFDSTGVPAQFTKNMENYMIVKIYGTKVRFPVNVITVLKPLFNCLIASSLRHHGLRGRIRQCRSRGWNVAKRSEHTRRSSRGWDSPNRAVQLGGKELEASEASIFQFLGCTFSHGQ